MNATRNDMERIFETYDLNQNGFLDYEELRELMVDLGLDNKYAEHDNPENAFDEFVTEVWRKYDLNWDGFINYEEFIVIHTDLIDK